MALGKLTCCVVGGWVAYDVTCRCIISPSETCSGNENVAGWLKLFLGPHMMLAGHKTDSQQATAACLIKQKSMKLVPVLYPSPPCKRCHADQKHLLL